MALRWTRLRLAPYQPQAYIAVETGPRASASTWPERNRAAAVVRLAKCATLEALGEGLAAEWVRFGGVGDVRFRRGLLAWAEERLLGLPESNLSLPSFEEFEGLKERQMAYLLEDRVAEWKAEWVAKGHAEGQRTLLEHLAETRFGGDSAAQLAEALSGGADVALSEAADLIVTCESAEEFSACLKKRGRAQRA